MTKEKFLDFANSPYRLRLFLFLKLPAAWFMGIGVRHCDHEKAVVSLPYGWRSQNPFRSIYFAAQVAAGELSTGILALAVLSEMPPVSMLVTEVRSQFHKKADQPLLFTCEQGLEVEAVIHDVVSTGAAQQLTLHSKGHLPDGTLASEVWITWSFKRK